MVLDIRKRLILKQERIASALIIVQRISMRYPEVPIILRGVSSPIMLKANRDNGNIHVLTRYIV